MEINEIIKEAFETAASKGWWEKPKSFGELLVLIHSEVSEALEEYREGHDPNQIYTSGYIGMEKPEGIPIELADVIIRICDLCGYYGIDLDRAIQEKMAYNKTRPHRHGGKVI